MATTNKQSANQSQKLMVFVLTMALYGLATLFTELIPKFQVGIVEFSVEYLLFIPLTPLQFLFLAIMIVALSGLWNAFSMRNPASCSSSLSCSRVSGMSK